MQIVVSQTWLLEGEEHAEAYIAKARAFEDFYRGRDGYIARHLVRSVEDPTHVLHLRWFRSIDDYLAMTDVRAYRSHIEDLSQHVDVERIEASGGYPREFGDVVWSSP